MATTTESKKMIKLYSSDGEEFEMEDSLAQKFRTNSKKRKAKKRKSKKMIKLCSDDGVKFLIEESEAAESRKLKRMFKDCYAESVIHLPEVNGKVLSKVVKYLRKHADSSSKSDEKTSDEELKAWDAEFVKVGEEMLFELITAAASLGIRSLERLAWSRKKNLLTALSDKIRDRISSDQIRRLTVEQKISE